LYTYLTRDFKKEIKVVQLSGAMIELAGYHHGNISAEATIVTMA